MSAATLQLRRRLEALPQELYDIIYDLSFTAEPGERKFAYTYARDKDAPSRVQLSARGSRRFCGRDSLSLLLVNRASHDKFQKSYYSVDGAVFTFDFGGWFERCAQSVAPQLRDRVRDVRVVGQGSDFESRIKPRLVEKCGQSIADRMRVGSEREVLGDLIEYQGQSLRG